MNKRMAIHHTINIILMITLIIFNYTNISGFITSLILAVLFMGNAILLIRASTKKIEKDGVTIDDYNKK
ncbi:MULTISPECIES: hypothetical protein [Staphylococcus]|uniref:hypothetical protein n=1 Tax=Staphylococcus TaxID=1279 RepID=UPI0008A3A71F|nr:MULTISPECIES: hypothetical protein [Staphylococcus]MDK7752981.1 hypothetical protein [Staphylococcus sp. UMB10092B]OFQ93554.1 hypothetical protein HMPREF2913_07675 [Staphylococcus sp. HMSC065A08]OHO39208.1 hypothetical protein HMPREF2586_04840 [Staphylococcus sp. HMSC034G07]OIS30124.1 hypothetical protein RES9_04685 [Staphylococcus cohnii]OIS32098.1 hypothetical protein RES10_05590 [Staphylococcus cohnii]